MKLIYKAGDIIEAHIISGLLNAEGIEAHVSGHYLQGGIGEFAPSGFSNIHVADEDIQQARLVIEEYEKKQNKPVENSSHTKPDFATRVIIISLTVLFFIFVYFLSE